MQPSFCGKKSMNLHSILQPGGNIFFRGILPEANESHRRLIEISWGGDTQQKGCIFSFGHGDVLLV